MTSPSRLGGDSVTNAGWTDARWKIMLLWHTFSRCFPKYQDNSTAFAIFVYPLSGALCNC